MSVNCVMMIEIKHTFFRNILLALSCQKQGYSVLIPLEIGVTHSSGRLKICIHLVGFFCFVFTVPSSFFSFFIQKVQSGDPLCDQMILVMFFFSQKAL